MTVQETLYLPYNNLWHARQTTSWRRTKRHILRQEKSLNLIYYNSWVFFQKIKATILSGTSNFRRSWFMSSVAVAQMRVERREVRGHCHWQPTINILCLIIQASVPRDAENNSFSPQLEGNKSTFNKIWYPYSQMYILRDMKCISRPCFIFLFGVLFYMLDSIFYDQKTTV